MTKTISVIVPIYNEAGFLKRSIEKLVNKLDKSKITKYELILIENGSKDASWNEVLELSQKNKKIVALQLPHASYGQAIKTGILAATHEYIVIFNVDFWDIDFLGQALALMPPMEIIVGSKTLIRSNDQRPIRRRLSTYFFNSFLKLFFNFPGTDTHGIKVLERELAQKFARRCRALHELVDTELILRACRHHSNYFELPIKVREIRPTRYNNWVRVLNTLIDLKTVFYTKLYDISHYRR